MLPGLLNIPRSETDWLRWGHFHRDQHLLIRQAILAADNINLPDYPLYPIVREDIGGFLQRNSQMHLDFNSVLGQQSINLQDVDFNDANQTEAWMFLHFQEHRTAAIALGFDS